VGMRAELARVRAIEPVREWFLRSHAGDGGQVVCQCAHETPLSRSVSAKRTHE
jgi:hypothetical protein